MHTLFPCMSHPRSVVFCIQCCNGASLCLQAEHARVAAVQKRGRDALSELEAKDALAEKQKQKALDGDGKSKKKDAKKGQRLVVPDGPLDAVHEPRGYAVAGAAG